MLDPMFSISITEASDSYSKFIYEPLHATYFIIKYKVL